MALLLVLHIVNLPLVASSIQKFWMFNCTDAVAYAHNVILEPIGANSIAASFQAGSTEGGDMHLRYTVSHDLGATWQKSTIIAPSIDKRSTWGPVLHYNERTALLHFFYAESRSFVANFSNPGGDVFSKMSMDLGETWSDPKMIFSQGDFDGNPKYLVNQLAVLSDGQWVLPFGTTANGYPEIVGKAGLLISKDEGITWISRPEQLQVKPDPYISAILEPAITPDGNSIFMRSANGWLYKSEFHKSKYGSRRRYWSQPVATSLPNPNSRPSICGDGDNWILASNEQNDGISNWPAWGTRSLLTLQLGSQITNGTDQEWTRYAILEDDDGVSHCYPSVVNIGGQLVTAYSVYSQNIPRIGIKVARVKAPSRVEPLAI